MHMYMRIRPKCWRHIYVYIYISKCMRSRYTYIWDPSVGGSLVRRRRSSKHLGRPFISVRHCQYVRISFTYIIIISYISHYYMICIAVDMIYIALLYDIYHYYIIYIALLYHIRISLLYDIYRRCILVRHPILTCFLAHDSVLQCVAVCYGVHVRLRRAHRNALQHTATQWLPAPLRIAAASSTRAATHRYTLQHTAHTATNWNTPAPSRDAGASGACARSTVAVAFAILAGDPSGCQGS